jgi:putative membrane protein
LDDGDIGARGRVAPIQGPMVERVTSADRTAMEHPASAPTPFATPPVDPDAISVELSKRRTGMSFQRTRMSSDRTLMSVIRTSLSLISFGFTIFQFFQHLTQANVLGGSSQAPRRFGMALVLLGVGMLIVGIAYQIAFMIGLRHERRDMAEADLIHAESKFPASFTLITAILLLVIGLLAIASLGFKLGPFN